MSSTVNECSPVQNRSRIIMLGTSHAQFQLRTFRVTDLQRTPIKIVIKISSDSLPPPLFCCFSNPRIQTQGAQGYFGKTSETNSLEFKNSMLRKIRIKIQICSFSPSSFLHFRMVYLYSQTNLLSCMLFT